MATDQIAEMISMFVEHQDDSAQFCAEIDALIEERPAHPHLADMEDARTMMADRFVFYEEMIARLLVGAPVLLRSI